MGVPLEPAERAPAPSTGIESLLSYAEQLSDRTEASLDDDLAALVARTPDDWSGAETIRFALLHVEGRSRDASTDDARRALERMIARSDEDRKLRMLARLLLDFLNAGAASDGAAATTVIAYPHRAPAEPEEANAEIESLRSQLAGESQRRLELERQLEALRALEAALDQRAANEPTPQ